MTWVAVVVLPAVIVVAAVAGAFFIRARHPPRHLRRMREETGWGAWCRVAATLPWRDRWQVRRVNATGRVVAEARLAPFAVQRAETVIAQHRWVLAHGAMPRWLRVISIVVWLLVAAVNLVAWLLDGGWFQLVLAMGGVALAALWAFLGRIQARSSRRAMARARRSIQANRLADAPD